MRLAAECDHDALDVEHPHDPGKAVRRAEMRDELELVLARARIRVDEPDEVDPVLGMVEVLAREQLADFPFADDDRVLEIRELPATPRARHSARGRDEHDRECPEHRELRQGGTCESRHPRNGEQQPRADGDEVEHAHHVVHGRVVGALLVAVVQPVELRDDDPRRQREEEHEVLPAHRHVIDRSAGWKDRFGDQERQGEPDDVGEEQCAPDEPPAPADDRRLAPTVEDLECALVDGRMHLVDDECALEQGRPLRGVHAFAPSYARLCSYSALLR